MPGTGRQAQRHFRPEKKERGKEMREVTLQMMQEILEKANDRDLEMIYAFSHALTRED